MSNVGQYTNKINSYSLERFFGAGLSVVVFVHWNTDGMTPGLSRVRPDSVLRKSFSWKCSEHTRVAEDI